MPDAITLPVVLAADPYRMTWLTGGMANLQGVWLLNTDGTAYHNPGVRTALGGMAAPDGRTIAIRSGADAFSDPRGPLVGFFDVGTGVNRWHPLPAPTGQWTWSPDGARVAAAVRDNDSGLSPGNSRVMIVEVASGQTQLITLQIPEDSAVSKPSGLRLDEVYWAPDGGHLVAGWYDEAHRDNLEGGRTSRHDLQTGSGTFVPGTRCSIWTPAPR